MASFRKFIESKLRDDEDHQFYSYRELILLGVVLFLSGFCLMLSRLLLLMIWNEGLLFYLCLVLMIATLWSAEALSLIPFAFDSLRRELPSILCKRRRQQKAIQDCESYVLEHALPFSSQGESWDLERFHVELKILESETELLVQSREPLLLILQNCLPSGPVVFGYLDCSVLI
jgi:hypothetical protein